MYKNGNTYTNDIGENGGYGASPGIDSVDGNASFGGGEDLSALSAPATPPPQLSGFGSIAPPQQTVPINSNQDAANAAFGNSGMPTMGKKKEQGY